MTILLFGMTGQLGQALLQATQDKVVGLDRSSADLNNPDQIRSMIDAIKPTVIINAAAYINVDGAEDEPELAEALNHHAVAVMAEAARKHDALLVTYSTDYVFDGSKVTPYTEADETSPLSIYGLSKAHGEEAVVASGCRHLILRTAWLHSALPNNFAGKILAAAQIRPELRVVDDQIGNPTLTKDLARATLTMLKNPDHQGIYHCASAGEVSRYGWAKRIVEQAGLSTPVIPIKTTEIKTPAQRPLNSRLSCQKLQDDFGIVMPRWDAYLG